MQYNFDKHSIDRFLEKLQRALADPLPGIPAQAQMAPPHRPMELRTINSEEDVRNSAVLILLWPEAHRIQTVFILRTVYDGVHSNQIAFPGGKVEPVDSNLIATALREANEEVGVLPESIKVLGQLTPLFIPPSRFLVYPVVGYSHSKPSFTQDPVEIQEVIPFPLFDFLDPGQTITKDLEVRGRILLNIPGFKIGDHLIWGATAMMLNELLEIIKPIVKELIKD